MDVMGIALARRLGVRQYHGPDWVDFFPNVMVRELSPHFHTTIYLLGSPRESTYAAMRK